MSALPKAVQDNIDLANKLMAEQAAARAAPPADPSAPPAAAPAAAAPVVTPPDPSAPPAAPAQMPDSDWEKRYRVLQGKYNAEVPRLQKQLHEQGDTITNIQQQLLNTQTLLANLNRAPPAAPAAPLVDEKEIKEFGPDLHSFIQRVARGEQASLISEIDRRVKPVADKVQQAQVSVEDQAKEQLRLKQVAMYDSLTEQVPTWEALNNDAGFLAWLNQVDPYAGHQRRLLLIDAENRCDTPRVVAFFKGYLKENAVVTPPVTTTPPAAAAAAPQVTLESMVAPGTAKPGVPSAQDGSGKRIWTRAEISKFFQEKAAGRYSGSEDATKRGLALERDIFAAQREQRVR